MGRQRDGQAPSRRAGRKMGMQIDGRGTQMDRQILWMDETGALFLISLFLMIIFPNGQSS